MVDLYTVQSKSLPQKLLIMIIEAVFIALSIYIMFGNGQSWFATFPGLAPDAEIPGRRLLLLGFSLVTFLRVLFTLFYLLHRKMVWAEVASIPFAFLLYYIGFAILILPNGQPLGGLDYFAIALFAFGGVLNTGSELQRDIFKKKPENKGRLFTGGLFAWSMHINFFGDVLWVSAFAIVAGHWLGIAIPVLLLVLFMVSLVPALDTYLRGRYGADFEAYEKTTKRLIPFIW